MKILFCSPHAASPELGASRVLLGVAAALEEFGWDCDVIDRGQMARATGMSATDFHLYPSILRAYLQKRAAEYDVVDYDIHHLAFARDCFPASTLLVARSVLLMDHLLRAAPPMLARLSQRAKRWLSLERTRTRSKLRRWVHDSHVTAKEADLINVANPDDRRILAEAGIKAAKTCVIPYGLDSVEFFALRECNIRRGATLRLCFLGTFDERKGGKDLVEIFRKIARKYPTCRFRLCGTAGQYQSREDVAKFFPRWMQGVLEIVPRFLRAELPGLVDDCTLGVFPSYAEGFGFGVLEMLAAGIPVLAYKVPGPPVMLKEELLVPPGDVDAFVSKVSSLLEASERLADLAQWSREQAQEFTWKHAASLTDRAYREAIARLQNGERAETDGSELTA